MNAHIISPVAPVSPADLVGRRVRFAVALTAAVATIAWFLASVADLSEETIVISIMVVAFIASWIATNTPPAAAPAVEGNHRVTVVTGRSRVR